MLLDAAVLAFLAAAASLGALAGLLRPLFVFAGAALGWLAARHLSGPLGAAFTRVMPAGGAQPAAAALLFVVVTLVVALAGRKLARAPGGGGRPLDRAAGALLAGLAAAAASWVGLAVADAIAPSLPASWQAGVGTSDLAGLVRQHDLLADWRRRAERALGALLEVAGDPGAAARLASDPDLKSLANDPRVRILLEEAPAAGPTRLERSPEALRLLADPEFRERLEAAQERLDRKLPRR